MPQVKLFPDIYWVGALDKDIKHFHGHTYSTKRGTTYNAYLIVDEKVTLVDTVYKPFQDEMISRIKEIVPLDKIDYIIANHVETDHSGALPKMMELCPKAKIFGSAKCKDGLYANYHKDWDFKIVKTGDELKLGKRTLRFIEAPMLHWPDSMFTYVVEDALLLPNDAFGQHYASDERFDDEVDQGPLMDEAAAYYANILWPLSALVVKKIEEVQKLGIPIKMIAPSHGVIWRKDPMKIVTSYLNWGGNGSREKVVIVYETMWESTAKMADKIAEGLKDSGIETKVYNINLSDTTNVIADMLDARGYIIGSSTHDNDMLSRIAGFLHFLKGLKPRKRIGSAFGSYGWAGGAVKNIEKILGEAGLELVQPSISIRYVPDETGLKDCHEFGKAFASKLKSNKGSAEVSTKK